MKKLSEICKRIQIKETNLKEDHEIKGVEVNSKRVKEGYVFFVTDGNEKYIDEAFKNGAKCLISEKTYNYPCITVYDVRESMALCCSDFYDNPEKKLKIVGVIGTNGKTSIAHIMYELFKPYRKVAVIGTIGVKIADSEFDSDMTTPDPPELYRILSYGVKNGVEYVFCEISAHAIYYKKFYGIRCEMCVFTNITQDHLDFFEDMGKYSKVKTGYFCKENIKLGIINSDDEQGREIINNNDICSISYGINQPSDVFAINISNDCGLKFIINAFDDIIFASTKFFGEFNVYNILASVTVARLAGIGPREIQSRLVMISPISGRANLIHENPGIVIDYAHTPDGLKNILSSIKKETKGKLIAVFGCGGNRDKTKRPIMGKIGTEIADVCIFTSDNPRYEDPVKIIDDIAAGAINDNYIKISDRTYAIEFALKLATYDDCVTICGKGCENYIEIKGEKYNYSDKAVCLAALEKLKCH